MDPSLAEFERSFQRIDSVYNFSISFSSIGHHGNAEDWGTFSGRFVTRCNAEAFGILEQFLVPRKAETVYF